MANPQKENGHIRISTELWDALVKIRISGEARQMLDFIIRKTYGFNKKNDRISTSQFSQATGMKPNAIHKNRKKLIELNVITVSQKGYGQILTYSLQKDYEKWKPYPKKGTVPQKENRCTPKRSRTVPQLGTDNKHIDTIQKKVRTFDKDSDAFLMAEILGEHILKNNPENKGALKEKSNNWQRWASEFDLLIRVDKRDISKTGRLLDWCQKNDFWKTNILSAGTFRKQYDKLLLQENRR